MSETFYGNNNTYLQTFAGTNDSSFIIAYPLLEREAVVGAITSEFSWRTYFEPSGLPARSDLLYITIRNSCGQSLPCRFSEEGSLQADMDIERLALLEDMV